MPANKPWAVLVFMVADELQLPAAHADIVEMQRVGSGSAVGIGVQIQIRDDDRFKRFIVDARPPKPDRSTDALKEWPLAPLLLQNGNISNKVGSSKTLRDFLFWGMETFKADNYLLVLWGHSFGFGFGRLKTPASRSTSSELAELLNLSRAGGRLKNLKSDDAEAASTEREPGDPAAPVTPPAPANAAGDNDGLLDLNEIGKALDEFNKERGQPLEILGHNTCNTSKAEIALALAGKSKYLVASQLAIPLFTGWPFKDVIERVVHTERAKPIEPKDLAVAIVDVFSKSYKPKIVALSALDLSKADVIRADVTDLSAALLAAMNEPGSDGQLNQALIALGFLQARLETASIMPREASEPAVDFYGLCDAIKKSVEKRLPSRPRGKLDDVLSIIARISPHRQTFVVETDVEGAERNKDGSSPLSGFLVMAPGLRKEDAVDPELQEWIHWPRGWYDTKWPDVIDKVRAVTLALQLPDLPTEQEEDESAVA